MFMDYNFSEAFLYLMPTFNFKYIKNCNKTNEKHIFSSEFIGTRSFGIHFIFLLNVP